MLITYERFGALTLPIYDPSEPIGAWAARDSFVDLPAGGAARGYGTGRAAPSTRTVRRMGTLLGASLGELDSAFAALLAACGTVDRLYGRRSDGAIVWTMAELSSVDALREPRTLFRGCPEVALDVETALTLYAPRWSGAYHGAGWAFDSGYHFDTGFVLDQALGDVFTLSDAGLTTCPVVNAGNASVSNAVVTITAGNAPITQVSIGSTSPSGQDQAQLLYTGTVAALRTLRIDMGGQIVESDSAGGAWQGDYEHFQLEPSHSIAEWLRLDPGTTQLEVAITSAEDATMLVSYSDGWA